MARPRIFISSTFYDLRQIRADLERFVKDLGYDPVLNERGLIPYGNKEKLEKYCYREIEMCDILVSIVGGRFGSQSANETYSISQMEFKRAFDLGKQCYVFIERNVYSEYNTYLRNKTNIDITYHSVNDDKIFKFIEEVYALPSNNVIHSFETAYDITQFLKEQWAGLFQRLLAEEERQREIGIIENLRATAKTLDDLVSFLVYDRDLGQEVVNHILTANHPVFSALKSATNTAYRIYFTNIDEMTTWIKARNYNVLDKEFWDDEDYMEFTRTVRDKGRVLRIYRGIFDESGKLKIISNEDWNSDYVKETESNSSDDEDEIPF